MSWLRDPRHYQLLVLATLLVYGIRVLQFPVSAGHVAGVLASCVLSQCLMTWFFRLPALDLRSPLITAVSLCLLLRVDGVAWAAAAGALAVLSKFLIRRRGRHLFNPSALAITVMVLASGHAWVSPGQWGHVAMAWLAMAGAGLVVLTRARRLDITLAFLVCWSLILMARGAWLSEPLTIAAHQLANGALVLFAFFMISDPRTTPSCRAGRILFATAVAAVAAVATFIFYRADGLIIALALCAPLVPIIDASLTGREHRRSGTDPLPSNTLTRSSS